jgi:hypothetical protein
MMGQMVPQQPQQPGFAQPMNALGGQMRGQTMQPLMQQNALMQRPDHPQFGQMPQDQRQGAMLDWRNALQAWHQQRFGLHGNGMAGGQGPMPGQMPPTGQMPINPYAYQAPANMVGSSYTVQGMTPAANGFGLPGY